MVFGPTTLSGIAEGYARARRSQLRADAYFRKGRRYFFAACHLLLRQWRRLVVLRAFSPLLRMMFPRWRLEADVRIRAMMLLRRWRDARMVHARRRRPARVLIRRSIEEWWTYMLVRRASRGGVIPAAVYTRPSGYCRGYTWPD